MLNLPNINFEFEGTPVAIAAMAVGGIVAVVYSPIDNNGKMLAVSALGQLAGGASGMATPKGDRRRLAPVEPLQSLANAPARFAAEFGEG